MNCLAVIDTIVLVSALLSKQADAATVQVVKAALSGEVVPIYNDGIMQEYEEVLLRPRFGLSDHAVARLLNALRQVGREACPVHADESLKDEDDRMFYESALSLQTQNAFLVTGNLKHCPPREFVVSPRQLLERLARA